MSPSNATLPRTDAEQAREPDATLPEEKGCPVTMSSANQAVYPLDTWALGYPVSSSHVKHLNTRLLMYDDVSGGMSIVHPLSGLNVALGSERRANRDEYANERD